MAAATITSMQLAATSRSNPWKGVDFGLCLRHCGGGVDTSQFCLFSVFEKALTQCMKFLYRDLFILEYRVLCLLNSFAWSPEWCITLSQQIKTMDNGRLIVNSG